MSVTCAEVRCVVTDSSSEKKNLLMFKRCFTLIIQSKFKQHSSVHFDFSKLNKVNCQIFH